MLTTGVNVPLPSPRTSQGLRTPLQCLESQIPRTLRPHPLLQLQLHSGQSPVVVQPRPRPLPRRPSQPGRAHWPTRQRNMRLISGGGRQRGTNASSSPFSSMLARSDDVWCTPQRSWNDTRSVSIDDVIMMSYCFNPREQLFAMRRRRRGGSGRQSLLKPGPQGGTWPKLLSLWRRRKKKRTRVILMSIYMRNWIDHQMIRVLSGTAESSVCMCMCMCV